MQSGRCSLCGSKAQCGAHLALEHVSQVAAALGAGDFRALHAEADVDVAVDGARNLVIERWPVQWFTATSSGVKGPYKRPSWCKHGKMRLAKQQLGSYLQQLAEINTSIVERDRRQIKM